MLENYIKGKTLVCVYIVNGYLMRGVIRREDKDTIVLRAEDGTESLVYKHAISTIRAAG